MYQSTRILGDLAHLLIHCPGLAPVRGRLWEMFCENSVKFPAFLEFNPQFENSPSESQIHFLLEAFPEVLEVLELWEIFGTQFIEHV